MLIGREDEVLDLSERLAARGATVVAGPPGIGKTTLCRSVLASLGNFGEAAALASLRWSPLLPFRHLVGSKVRDDPDGVVGQVLQLGFQGLLIDDGQWADELSARTVELLVGRVPLLVSLRTGDPGTEAARRRFAAAGCGFVELRPLDVEASSALVDLTRSELGEHQRRAVLEQAHGNPLLLSRLALDDRGSPTLMRALQARLEDEPAEVRDAMNRLGVLGRPAPADLLGSGADGLVQAGLAQRNDDGSVAVRHALLGELVVEALGDRADDIRRELATQVSDAEAAFLLARAGDRSQARAAALTAAEGDVPRRTAAELLDLAVTCGPEDLASGLDVRMAAARAFTSVGQPTRALDLCLVHGADALERPQRGALFAVAAEAAWIAGHTDRFIDLIGRAVEDLRGSRTGLEVQALAGSTIVETRIGLDGRPAIERAHEAVALADELGEQQVFARYRLASVLLTAGEPGWAELYREVIAAAAAAGDDALRLAASQSLVLGAWSAGSIDDAADAAEVIDHQGAPVGFESAWLGSVAYGPLLSVLAGRDRAEVIERWVPRLRREPLFQNRTFACAGLIVAAADLGRHDEAAALLADHADPEASDPQLRALLGWARAEAAWAAGRPAEVGAVVAAVEALQLGGHPAVVNARLVSAHACMDLGVAPTGDEPEPLLPAWAGAPLEWRGLVAMAAGDLEAAMKLLDRAAQAWAGHDRRSETRARWSAGEVARRAGVSEATDRLRGAEEMATATGFLAVVLRARRSQRAAGAGRGANRSAGVAGLTARETDVLRRVGAGLTSRQIAAELHVSPSTIDTLVRSGTRKLGASNRRAAAGLLAERDDHRNGGGH